MELLKTDKKLKCDVAGCKNMCDYSFVFRKNLFHTNMYVCKTCLNEMYKQIGKHIVPTSISNVYKKKNEIKEA